MSVVWAPHCFNCTVYTRQYKAPHIWKTFLCKGSLTYRFCPCTRNVICSFGGGVLAAVTFLCKTSWKNSIVFFESLNISESSLQNIKKKQLHNTKSSLYIRIIPYLFHTFILLRLPCIENTQIPLKNVSLEDRSNSRKCFLKITLCVLWEQNNYVYLPLYLWLAHPLRDKTFNSNGWIVLFFLQTIVYIDELIDIMLILFSKKVYCCLDYMHGA